MAETYEGWKNRQTWNVALWFDNDVELYWGMIDYLRKRKKKFLETGKLKVSYYGLIRHLGLVGERTPDNISFSGTKLAYSELNEWLMETYEKISV